MKSTCSSSTQNFADTQTLQLCSHASLCREKSKTKKQKKTFVILRHEPFLNVLRNLFSLPLIWINASFIFPLKGKPGWL